MAVVKTVNNLQALKESLSASNPVPGARSAQAPAQELQKPRAADQIQVSKEAQDRAKAEESRFLDQGRAQAAQQRNVDEAKQQQAKEAQAPPKSGRLDVTV